MIKISWAGAILVLVMAACGEGRQAAPHASNLRGASSYTPYDALAMLWSRGGGAREYAWVSSGAEAGRLLTSAAEGERRPDWILCTQGVVAGLAARGKDPVILASVHKSTRAILPVFRKPRAPLSGARGLYIPRSSIEFAFDRLLEREHVTRADVRVPTVEKPSFTTIESLLRKPAADADALDFGILVDPFLSNLVHESPMGYEVGHGGLYEMHYSVVALRKDVEAKRAAYESLLRELLDAEKKFEGFKTDDAFYDGAWGRQKAGAPERLPRAVSFDRKEARVQLEVSRLRTLLGEEIRYLVAKYPSELRAPPNIAILVDPSVLSAVEPTRVTP